MDIDLDNFKSTLPFIQKAIQEADFIAVDCELTGLQTAEYAFSLNDDIHERYFKLRRATKNYRVIQLGLCTFHTEWKNKKPVYIAKPFNFYAFPREGGELGRKHANFMINSQSLVFLAEQGFDFNRLVRKGIPYWNHQQEADAMSRYGMHNKNEDIPEDDENRAFIQETKETIQAWLQGMPDLTLVINTQNAYYRRLVYQIVKKSYNGFIMAKRKDFSVELKRLTVEERDAIAKEAGQALLIGVENLSQVVRTMVEAKKPLVGHNCLLDICHIIQHFWDDLPESVEGWRKMMLQLWDRVIDTKQLAHHHADILAFNNTTLANIMSIVNDVPFTENCAEIVLADGFHRYTTTSMELLHEAGYDAYCTGIVLLRMAATVIAHKTKRQDEVRASTEYTIMELLDNEYIRECTNILYLMRASPNYLDLAQASEVVKSTFIISGLPAHIQIAELQFILRSASVCSMVWIDSDRCRIQVCGRLGEEQLRRMLKSYDGLQLPPDATIRKVSNDEEVSVSTSEANTVALPQKRAHHEETIRRAPLVDYSDMDYTADTLETTMYGETRWKTPVTRVETRTLAVYDDLYETAPATDGATAAVLDTQDKEQLSPPRKRVHLDNDAC